MASHDITEKIKNILRQESYSERDVVYFLVESYKFLERKYSKMFGQGKYNQIKFYRNWTCHAQLCGDSNKIFIDFIALIKAEKSKPNAYGHLDWRYSMADRIKERFREYGPLHLKEEILEFLSEIKYDGDFSWESFRANLYEVIRDIPLVIKDEKENIFTFEVVAPIAGGKYDSLELRAFIIGDGGFSFTLDDRSL
jgi:hypothetical protein